jgi:hypothetical protein
MNTQLVQPEVARATRVCAYDRAGLGWSGPSPNPRTSEAMVKEDSDISREWVMG